jgi:acetyl-CoA synthetase
MRDYLSATKQFNYQHTVDAALSGTLEALNACVECCDRHALPGRIALFWEGRDGTSATYTFSDLQDKAARFANFLLAQGVQKGDKVAGLLPRNIELLITVFATWRIGAVYQPLFTAFGPKAIEHRLNSSGAKVVVTDAVNRPKLAKSPTARPSSPSAAPRVRASSVAISASGPSWPTSPMSASRCC